MRFKAIVTVRPPDRRSANYKGIEVPKSPEKADDEDVDASLETLRNDAATLVPVDRARPARRRRHARL